MKAIVLATTLLTAGCTQNRARENLTVKSDSIQSNSVDELKSLLPNWKAFQIDECKFVKQSELRDSGLPAPSDQKLQFGWAKLSNSSAIEIAAFGDWTNIDATDIPSPLQESMTSEPAPFRVSKSFNGKFNRNARYAHGFVILPSGAGDRIFFIAADLDHPIE